MDRRYLDRRHVNIFCNEFHSVLESGVIRAELRMFTQAN
jgi:hypothetical protein